jgi:hypothetical protein
MTQKEKNSCATYPIEQVLLCAVAETISVFAAARELGDLLGSDIQRRARRNWVTRTN